MTRDEQEMALWTAEYVAARAVSAASAACAADEAVEQFRKRYPPQAQAPPAVWYDEPPFAKDGSSHPCWVEGATKVAIVYWARRFNEYQWIAECHGGVTYFLLGRRVCPIVKPPEPPQ